MRSAHISIPSPLPHHAGQCVPVLTVLLPIQNSSEARGSSIFTRELCCAIKTGITDISNLELSCTDCCFRSLPFGDMRPDTPATISHSWQLACNQYVSVPWNYAETRELGHWTVYILLGMAISTPSVALPTKRPCQIAWYLLCLRKMIDRVRCTCSLPGLAVDELTLRD